MLTSTRSARLIARVLTLLSASTLTACATSPRPSAPAVTWPEIPAALRTPCRAPQALADGTSAAVRVWAVQTVLDARECAARHEALTRVLHPPPASPD